MKGLSRILWVTPFLAACANQPAPKTIGDLARQASPSKAEGELQVSREEAIEQYERFLASSPDHERQAEALQRLADLELEIHEGRLATAEVPPVAGLGGTPPPADDPRAQVGDTPADAAASAPASTIDDEEPSAQSEVVALYLERLERYPDHPNNDEVLYQLARAYQAQGQEAMALATLERLTKEYPNSRLTAEARFRLGEAHFVKRDYADAELSYREVLERGESTDFFEPALHKYGWSLFKREDYTQAVDALMRLVEEKGVTDAESLEQLPRADRERVEDALRAISLAFSYLDGPAGVAAYFARYGRSPQEPLIYRRLGEEYLAKGRYSDAAETFATYVAAYPQAERAPEFQRRVADAYREGGFPGEVMRSEEHYVQLFDLDGPYWNTRDPAAYPELVEQLRQSMHDLARYYHARVQHYGEQQDYEQAARWYRHYLKRFPAAAGAQEMHLLFGDLLYEQGDYPLAIEQYEQAAYHFAHNGHAAEAAHAVLTAFEKHIATLEGEEKLDWEMRSYMAMRRFAEAFPNHPQAAPALVHAAEQLYEREEHIEAAIAAETLLEREAETPDELRLSALIVLGNASFDTGDYLRAEEAYTLALASSELDPALRGGLADSLAASLYKQGEQHQRAGDLAAAVDRFLEVRNAVPDNPLVANAEVDAATLLIQLEDYPRAADILERLRREYPGHELQPQITEKLAVAYTAAGDPARAAPEYARIAESNDGEIGREALWSAAEAFREADQHGQAVAAFEQYLKRYPQPLAPAVEAHQALIELYAEHGDDNAVRRWREALIAADADGGDERTARTRRLAAEASLALAREHLPAYRQVALVEPLADNLKRKRALMQKALDALQHAASYRFVGTTTAATYEIGELYADFAQAMLESERPANLDGEALAEYEQLLAQQAAPFQNRAIEFHAANAARTADGVYDDAVRNSLERLAQLMPARYDKEERRPEYVLASQD